jgi:hypothetical protein
VFQFTLVQKTLIAAGEIEKMIEEIDPKIIGRSPVRCEECDREMEHYNTFVTPSNERRNICWECLARQEKGFFAHRDFRRGARNGYIPR